MLDRRSVVRVMESLRVCKSCACVKRLQPCSNCLPMKHVGCSNSSASLTIADTESSFSSAKSMASAPPSDIAPSPHSLAPPQPSMNSLSSSLPLLPPQPPRPPPQPPPPQRFISKGKPCIVQGCLASSPGPVLLKLRGGGKQ